MLYFHVVGQVEGYKYAIRSPLRSPLPYLFPPSTEKIEGSKGKVRCKVIPEQRR